MCPCHNASISAVRNQTCLPSPFTNTPPTAPCDVPFDCPTPPGQCYQKKSESYPPYKKNDAYMSPFLQFAPYGHISRTKYRLGGHYMTPRGGWPIFTVRGVSQPTPNAPEAPRAIGVCLDISNTHVPKYVHVCNCPHLMFKSKLGTPAAVSAPRSAANRSPSPGRFI